MKLTDASGNVAASYSYGAYGELLSGDATMTSFLYNGRLGVMTDDNGLYYMRQRYYNTEIKRFINQDVVRGSLGNSQSLNRYSYVQGNPISYTDPFGLSPLGMLFSGTNLAHAFFGALGCLPGVAGAAFDTLDAFVYILYDHDYEMAAWAGLSALSGYSLSIAQSAKMGAKYGKSANGVATAASWISNASSFALNVGVGYKTASGMYEKYAVQGKSADLSTVGEITALVFSFMGGAASGKGMAKDTKAMVKAMRETDEASELTISLAKNVGNIEKSITSFYFRGTSEGYAGNLALQRLEITPTSTDPLVATVFATNGEQYGKGVLYIADSNDLKGITQTASNVLESYEKEIAFNILPLDFVNKASTSLSAKDARNILKKMGYEIPSKITNSEMSSILKELPSMSLDEINEFVKMARGM